MFAPNKFLQELRETNQLSQRDFAKLAKLSFRQFQRVESGESDISFHKLSIILTAFNFECTVKIDQPNWRLLCTFGLPISNEGSALPTSKKTSLNSFFKELNRAIGFLLFNRDNPEFERHMDAVKALLLSLRTHYPSLFDKFSLKASANIRKLAALENVEGRLIKLRNISLALLNKRLKLVS